MGSSGKVTDYSYHDDINKGQKLTVNCSILGLLCFIGPVASL